MMLNGGKCHDCFILIKGNSWCGCRSAGECVPLHWRGEWSLQHSGSIILPLALWQGKSELTDCGDAQLLLPMLACFSRQDGRPVCGVCISPKRVSSGRSKRGVPTAVACKVHLLGGSGKLRGSGPGDHFWYSLGGKKRELDNQLQKFSPSTWAPPLAIAELDRLRSQISNTFQQVQWK